MPGFIEPCDPTLHEGAPVGSDWVYDIKTDGYRAQVHIHDAKVTVYSPERVRLDAAVWAHRKGRSEAEGARRDHRWRGTGGGARAGDVGTITLP